MRQKQAYPLEDNRIEQQPSQSIVSVFLKENRSSLDPPQYNYTSLRLFLEKADEVDLLQNQPASQNSAYVALVDDRCDRTGWQDISKQYHSARNWDIYAQRPPPGDCQQSSLLSVGDLYRRFKTNVRLPNSKFPSAAVTNL